MLLEVVSDRRKDPLVFVGLDVSVCDAGSEVGVRVFCLLIKRCAVFVTEARLAEVLTVNVPSSHSVTNVSGSERDDGWICGAVVNSLNGAYNILYEFGLIVTLNGPTGRVTFSPACWCDGVPATGVSNIWDPKRASGWPPAGSDTRSRPAWLVAMLHDDGHDWLWNTRACRGIWCGPPKLLP